MASHHQQIKCILLFLIISIIIDHFNYSSFDRTFLAERWEGAVKLYFINLLQLLAVRFRVYQYNSLDYQHIPLLLW